eukprot:CAMPEP_0116143622 /NCGR_PEP_ID=MMETSP0329-20121206/15552_1 /TAXON_ID=697910 /ORGANISM="Pseudo-nitzschia arenysensis, Strain B593" /LENGTH=176 /DNA_ID=CAMNT_0003638961 /DNA_START=9 /DNA_END=536 /DNA_ORIENTATION=-
MSNKKAKFDTWSFDEPVKSLSSWNSLSEATIAIGGQYKAAAKGDLVFVCYCDSALEGDSKSIDDGLDGALSALLEEAKGEDAPKTGSMTPTLRIKGSKYILVALGKADEVNAKTGTAVGKALATKCVDEASSSFQNAVVLLPAGVWSCGFLKELSIAIHSSLYSDLRFRGTLMSIK